MHDAQHNSFYPQHGAFSHRNVDPVSARGLRHDTWQHVKRESSPTAQPRGAFCQQKGNITMKTYVILAVFATAILYGFGTDQWNNVMSIGGGADVSNFVVAIGTLGLVGGFFLTYIWRQNKIAGIIVGLGVMLSMLFSMGASIDRVASAKTDKIHAAASINDRIARLNTRIRDLRAKRNEEAGRRGCGRICRQWQLKLDAAMAERNRYGVTKETDQGSKTIEFLTGGYVRAKHFRLTHSPMGVLALTFLIYGLSLVSGTMVFSGGPAPRKRVPEDNVIDWVQTYHAKHKRPPAIKTVQSKFPNLPHATAHRRIRKALDRAA